jgi:hypothetical protein
MQRYVKVNVAVHCDDILKRLNKDSLACPNCYVASCFRGYIHASKKSFEFSIEILDIGK